MLDYRAKILTPWIDLSEQHSNFRKKAEQVIEAFSRGKSVPHIAVTGPYGQGKTQFLFHLMRIALDNNCIPVYTYASSLRDLVTETTNAAKFADIVHTAAFAEVDAIRKNKPGPLTTDTALSDFIRDRSPTGLPKAPVILFVDEWEQVYAELQNVVTTSDRNPLRALFDRSDIHLVLGFAPLSSYESGAGNLLGQGEADRRRLTVFRIPPVSPRQFRDYLQLDPGQANFFWWLGRGRMGLVLKAYQDSKNFDIQSSDGISSLVNVSMGNISGVPALDLDTLFEKSNWREIYDLHPRDAASATRCVFILDEGFEEKSKAFFMKLGFTAANSLSLGHYLQMLLEALSNKDGIAVLNSAEDFTVLVEATRDLALEFVDSPEAAHAFQERYEGLGSQADLTMRGLLDTTGTVGELKDYSLALPFEFKDIVHFFPFPLSVPTLPGASEADVTNWIQQHGSKPLAEDRIEDTHFLVFEDFLSFSKYTREHERVFVERSLPQLRHSHIALLSGVVGDLNGVALWLQTQGRLTLSLVQPKSLADLIRNSCYLSSRQKTSCSATLRDRIHELQISFERDGDRATARKILLYLAALNQSFRDNCQTHSERYTYTDERRGPLANDFQRLRESYAFTFPFWLAFAIEDHQSFDELANLRSFLIDGGPLSRFLPQEGGYRTAVNYLPTRRGSQPSQLNEQVKRVRDFYKPMLTELNTLADVVSEDLFTGLVEDDLSRFLLRSIFRLKGEMEPTQPVIARLVDRFKHAIEIRDAVSETEDQLESVTGLKFDSSLNFLAEEGVQIRQLINILENASALRKEQALVLIEFANGVAGGIQEKSGTYDKSVKVLKYDPLWSQILRLEGLSTLADTGNNDLLEYLELSRDRLATIIDDSLKQSRTQASSSGPFDQSSLESVHRLFQPPLELLDAINAIQNRIATCNELLAKLPDGGGNS